MSSSGSGLGIRSGSASNSGIGSRSGSRQR